MRQSEIQLTPSGGLRHFIDFDGLTTAHLEAILTRANGYLGPQGEIINRPDLAGTTVMNLFFEPSTRTRTTFEVAASSFEAACLCFLLLCAAVGSFLCLCLSWPACLCLLLQRRRL